MSGGLDDITSADISDSNWHEAHATFDEMELKENLLRGIYAYGFEKPSTIQQRGIVPLVRGFDTIAQVCVTADSTCTFETCSNFCMSCAGTIGYWQDSDLHHWGA